MCASRPEQTFRNLHVNCEKTIHAFFTFGFLHIFQMNRLHFIVGNFHLGGFKDTGDYWRSWYESADFKNLMDQTFQEVLPLYEELHTYIRRKLLAQYPGKFSTSAIPAHILGNM